MLFSKYDVDHHKIINAWSCTPQKKIIINEKGEGRLEGFSLALVGIQISKQLNKISNISIYITKMGFFLGGFFFFSF
jgi:hypothetical protein